MEYFRAGMHLVLIPTAMHLLAVTLSTILRMASFSGSMSAATVGAAEKNGMYCYIKHFALI